MKRVHDRTVFFLIAWLAILASVIYMSTAFDGESYELYGIADSSEITIASKHAVEIKKIAVVDGKFIKKGDLLVELNNPELNIKINQISHQLEQFKIEKTSGKSEIVSKIRELKATRVSTVSSIKFKIKLLEKKYNLNRELTSELKSIEDVPRSAEENPITLEIMSLKQEMRYAVNPINERIKLLEKELGMAETPIEVRVERLQKELSLLKEEEKKLSIVSEIDGVIGSIHFKQGEKVAPFVAIMTIHTKNPSYIKGYIHENVYNKIGVGKKVKIASLADGKNKSIGVVVGVGARIVEFPSRLRKHPEIKLWGREVVVRINSQNRLLLGEKVRISSKSHQTVSERLFSFSNVKVKDR